MKWILVFGGILLLTQIDAVIHFSKEPGLFGFPLWLYYFCFVHLVFVIALYYFNKSGEQTREES